MVAVWSFNFPSEAYPLMAKLEAEGIPCSLSNEHVVLVDPLISNAVGGVRILVPDSEENHARRIVEEYFRPAPMTTAPLDPKWSRDFEAVQTWCPNCDAYPVYRKKFSAGKTGLAFLLTLLSYPLAFFFLPKRHYCALCGYEWVRS